MSTKVQFPPLRGMHDFLTGTARFGLPESGNSAKWKARVLKNLQYYQSNYFLLVVVCFLLVGCLQPVRMMAGVVAVTAVSVGYEWSRRNGAAVRRAQRESPAGAVVAIALCCLALCHLLGGLVFFLSGVALPLLLVMLHASLRLRNMRNKVSNQMEQLGVKRTPMGLLLEALGQNPDAHADETTEVQQRSDKSR